jgi:hypothetical protein
MRSILEHGFKTREELGGDVHATGAGTAHAISFTLDRRVAQAIALGLRTLRRGSRGETLFGDLIVQAHECAPRGLKLALDGERVTPEDVVHYDAGKHPVNWRGGWFGRSLTEAQARELEGKPGVELEWMQTAGGSAPYGMRGWVPIELLVDLLERADPGNEGATREAQWIRYRSRFYGLYKTILGQAGFLDEVYDPLFMSTRLDMLANLDERDIGIVEARVAADWLCTAPDTAERLVSPDDVETLKRRGLSTGYDWARQCEGHLDNQARGGDWKFDRYIKPVLEWDDPDRRDTVAYVGHSMAELRVWDTALIRNVHRIEDVDDTLHEAREAWEAKGKNIEEPLFWPHFKPLRGR